MGKILARYVHEKPVPGKLFLFDNGCGAYGSTLEEQVENARQYARIQLECPVLKTDDPKWGVMVTQWGGVFTLGIMWGVSGSKVIDLYGYKDVDRSSVDSWRESNPDVTMWVIREYTPAKRGESYWANGSMASCETSLMILGREAIHRRGTGSLEEYMRSHANLREMEPSEPYRSLRI